MSDVDAVAEAIWNTDAKSGDWPWSQILTFDRGNYRGMAQAAIDTLRPTVRTVEQLEALPERSVVRDRGGRVFEKTDDWACGTSGFSSWWTEIGIEGQVTSDELDDLPALVLWQPEAVNR